MFELMTYILYSYCILSTNEVFGFRRHEVVVKKRMYVCVYLIWHVNYRFLQWRIVALILQENSYYKLQILNGNTTGG